MYLRTPKRYTARGSKKPLISLRWLWLYLLAPVIIIGGALAWNYRADLSSVIGSRISKVTIQLNAPTLTPTLPAADLKVRIGQSLDGGNIADALDTMRTLVAADPNEVQWHAALAQMLALHTYNTDKDIMTQAQQAGLSAINANPEVADGWISEALALDWSGQSKQALSYALRAKDLGDANGMTPAVLAGIYFSLGDDKQAASLADTALKINPNLAYTYFVQGQIAGNNGDIKGAIALYKQAWQISNTDHTQWGGYIADALVQAYAGQSQTDQATVILNQAAQRDKDDPRIYYRQSVLYLQQGDKDKAAEAAQNCVDHSANYLPCHEQLTVLHYLRNEYEKSAQSAQVALGLGSADTKTYYFGGEANKKLGKCADAVPMLQAGLDIARKANKTSAVSDFTAALAECGAISATVAAPIATADATPAQTTTPKKR